ncbi:DMT family transporter [Pseudomonas sp.]|uniref:DMT family transporter n=1 Tax=Pseudomonas sp. TaxID=306 RepID=UPI002C6E5966|nr:DMT family transporter [Pseudomonas sp.]HUE94161.1 DMT family transporter [Pseudomonas sp.]
MNFKSTLASYGVMMLFVLLWGSAAIFTRWGLDHGSAFALLVFRFALAFGVLLILGLWRKSLLPAQGTRWRVATIGLLLIGSYTICYFQAMAHGITPGLIATVMGAQPILTLLFVERRFNLLRLSGLLIGLGGLILVVYQSLVLSRFAVSAMLFAFAALACMTTGTIWQKHIQQSPAEVLPLQYGVSLLLCLAFVPFQPFDFEMTLGFFAPALWMGLIISVVAQLLLYRMIRSSNLVNVTSLFYLVPAVTAAMDYLFLGNLLPSLSILGMAAILLGVVLVFKQAPAAR